MQKALHGISVYYTNVLTQVRLAHECGYDGLEFLSEHLIRYLDHGGDTKSLLTCIKGYDLQVLCINPLERIGRHGSQKAALMSETRQLSQIAAELECPTIQILCRDELEDKTEIERMQILTENVTEIADIGAEYGVRFQIEFVAHTQFNSLDQAIQLINTVGKANVGIVVDFWHLYATGKQVPSDLAKIDPKRIFGIHFCDGRKPKSGEAWDESIQRAYFPGTGEIDIPAWVAAVKATGFDGTWSSELFSPHYWEYEASECAKLCIENMTNYIG